MKVSIVASTDGSGKNSDEVRNVKINKLSFGFQSITLFPEDEYTGELKAHFDPSGFEDGTWSVDGHGFICGDRKWIREFKKGLRQMGLSIKAIQNVKYSDLDRQGNDYVCLDIGEKFYTSWCRINKIKRNKNA